MLSYVGNALWVLNTKINFRKHVYIEHSFIHELVKPTDTTQVLFEWFVELGDGKYVADVPGSYSQVLTKKDSTQLHNSTIVLFLDFSNTQHDLELAFGQFAAAFPSYPIPEITTFFGGFNFGDHFFLW